MQKSLERVVSKDLVLDESVMEKILSTISYMPQLDLLVQMTKDNKDNGIYCQRYHYQINDKHYLLVDNEYAKVVVGTDYNYIFLKKDIYGKKAGFFQRWGTSPDNDPVFSPIGPEILDIEISVNGCPPIGDGGNCRFCYKGNTSATPTNMTFETFKKIIDKFPKTLTQVAFGITGTKTNPDFLSMMTYCRVLGIIPNFTLSGADLEEDMAKTIAGGLSGALAVSCYKADKNLCYDTVKKFTDLGMNQVNIHLMVSEETLEFVYEVLKDRLSDPRLSKLNAIVFLGVKPKGRAKGHYHSLSRENYEKLIEYCFSNNLTIGFDSCSAPKFEQAVNNSTLDSDAKKKLIQSSESCESSLISSYCNVNGEYWHCSFTENENGQTYVDVLNAKDFLTDVWYSDTVKNFRKLSIDSMVNGCRHCIVFPSINL